MNSIIIFSVLFSICAAAVLPEDSQATITKYQNWSDGAGNYKFSYETSNGIVREETGYLVNAGQENQYTIVKGSYTYKDLDGKLVIVEYTADETGSHYSSPLPKAVSFVPANFSTLGK